MNARLMKALHWMSVLSMLSLLAIALPQRAKADDNDPPGRVARLNYLRGLVSFQPAGELDWASAAVNRPMTTGDMLWADAGARAEMHLGSATVRLGARTGLSFLNLDDRTTQIQLSEGTLNIRVLRLDPDEDFEVDTPNLAFSILAPGQYRIQASDDGNSTLVTVRDGNGEVTGGGRTYTVGSGLSGSFTGTDSLDANIFRAGGFDEFDTWSQDRDRRDAASRSARYVSHDVVGYEDLDDNGSWRSDPDYGDVWVPRVAAGWAPYRNGHWAWISPWGWTWVDDASWGYAPFHYGRWVYARNTWGWVPGPITVRPVYAPALVAFVGGPQFGLSISVGGGRGGVDVGWFPLGPREVYVPGYNASREYVTRVNVSNTIVNNTTVINVYNNQVTNNNGRNRNIPEIRYANRTAPGGVTVVSQATFTNAQSVGRATISVNPRELASAQLRRNAEVAPTRSSVFGTSAPMGPRVVRPSAGIINRSVVAKRPPPPPPVPFERQQQKLAAQPGQPLARTDVEALRPANSPMSQPHIRQAPPGRPATAGSNQFGGRPNAPGSNAPPANMGGNPPATNVPPGRDNRQNEPNRGQFGNAPPSTPPPTKTGGNPPINNTPPANNFPPARNDRQNGPNFPGRNDQQNGPNRGQPNNVQPTPQPPANPGANPPANNAPPTRNDRQNGPNFPGRNDQQNGPNRGQPNNVQPTPQPPANPGANPPANNAPPTRNDRQNGPNFPGRNDQQNGPNRGQPSNVQPTPQPPANPGANPPANNAPPSRNDRQNGSNFPGRNDQQNGPNRGQPNNVQTSPPPTKTGGGPPPNGAPPGRDNRMNGPNPGQPANNPAPAPEPAKPDNQKATQSPKPQAPPQAPRKDDNNREKHKPDDQPPQR